MGWFNKILVQKVNNGEIVDITELDREHYESFLDVTERLKIAYGIAILREGKESSNEKSNCIKHAVIKSVCPKCGNDKYFDSRNGKIQCRTCGKWWRKIVL